MKKNKCGSSKFIIYPEQDCELNLPDLWWEMFYYENSDLQ